MHKLLFYEPCIFDPKSKKFEDHITVNDEMYKLLVKNNCTQYISEDYCHNAYVFGKLYPLHYYKYVTDHYNDAAQTGFIDLDLVKSGVWFKKDKKGKKLDWPEIYDWDDNNLRKTMRKINKAIVWFGTTYGGDVGASLHIHKTKGEIDSIIVDNGFFFGQKDSDSDSDSDDGNDSVLEYFKKYNQKKGIHNILNQDNDSDNDNDNDDSDEDNSDDNDDSD
ncbi:hypothetical protein [Powai lake megavirus]|uniref:Uncharacterized protein n=1 Tax=Powai lake megavirus TaxID=1842663 RepID=A0A167R348_9VIRU|nr:hypothetical protein QJ849_gp094 [Powai lake megavirus]ANB50256.1 hypothetical protein [Powai lake megavirus]